MAGAMSQKTVETIVTQVVDQVFAKVRAGVPIHRRYIWNVDELAQMLGVSATYIRDHIVNDDGDRVKACDIVDDHAWFAHQRARIPVRRDEANGTLRFWAHEVRAAVERATGLPLPGAGE